jgi:hypothetical protein
VEDVSSDLERGDSTGMVREWLLERSTVETWGIGGWNDWERIWAIIDERGCSVFAEPSDLTVALPDRLQLETPSGLRFEEELRSELHPILNGLRRLVEHLQALPRR